MELDIFRKVESKAKSWRKFEAKPKFGPTYQLGDFIRNKTIGTSLNREINLEMKEIGKAKILCENRIFKQASNKK